jgi:hypothetical protein
MNALPAAAVTAAIHAMETAHTDRGWNAPASWWTSDLAKTMLEAAEPHFRTAEQEHLNDRPFDEVMKVINRIAHEVNLPLNTAAELFRALSVYAEHRSAEASAAERERIRQLAINHGAGEVRAFADLIGGDT